tara:strand:+ start:446 stop:1294 length:849 start_codon:yes stop_codon:yes gene_type:complete
LNNSLESENHPTKAQHDSAELKNASILPAAIAACLVVLAWALNWYLLKNLDSTDRGSFGDMFGAANAAFSGLAFVGVVYAIYLQRYEVRIAKHEIFLTKQILKDQTRHLEAQNLSFQKNSFETTFFRMLEEYRSIVADLDLDGKTKTVGKDVFRILLRRARSSMPAYPTMYTYEEFDTLYNQFHTQNSDNLGHYFRFLYNILKFIDKSEIDEKHFYSNLLRAQLTDSERNLLMLNCASNLGRDKFKPLVEKYTMLKNANAHDELWSLVAGRFANAAFKRPSP